jgi:hypothetical protein
MIDWSAVPTVVTTAPHCPECFALRPMVTRTDQNGDGTVTRKCICRECSLAFKIAVELPLPNSGNWTLGQQYDSETLEDL